MAVDSAGLGDSRVDHSEAVALCRSEDSIRAHGLETFDVEVTRPGNHQVIAAGVLPVGMGIFREEAVAHTIEPGEGRATFTIAKEEVRETGRRAVESPEEETVPVVTGPFGIRRVETTRNRVVASGADRNHPGTEPSKLAEEKGEKGKPAGVA